MLEEMACQYHIWIFMRIRMIIFRHPTFLALCVTPMTWITATSQTSYRTCGTRCSSFTQSIPSRRISRAGLQLKRGHVQALVLPLAPLSLAAGNLVNDLLCVHPLPPLLRHLKNRLLHHLQNFFCRLKVKSAARRRTFYDEHRS
jgi:hypothetical protein